LNFIGVVPVPMSTEAETSCRNGMSLTLGLLSSKMSNFYSTGYILWSHFLFILSTFFSKFFLRLKAKKKRKIFYANLSFHL